MAWLIKYIHSLKYRLLPDSGDCILLVSSVILNQINKSKEKCMMAEWHDKLIGAQNKYILYTILKRSECSYVACSSSSSLFGRLINIHKFSKLLITPCKTRHISYAYAFKYLTFKCAQVNSCILIN